MPDNGLTFEKITTDDIIPFINFLEEANPDYPYRWFFDPFWIASKVNDVNYIWGVLKQESDGRQIVGTVICYYDPEKKINFLKLLLVHPKFRGKGILNNIFFKRLHENRVVDEIQAYQPNLLYAEILVNRLTSQKMVQKIGMSLLGYFPGKSRRDDVRLDLVPCGLLFKKRHKVIKIDERIAPKVENILKVNKLTKIRNIKEDKEESTLNRSNSALKEVELRDREQHEKHLITINGSNFLEYQYNTYINTISEARMTVDTPDNANILVKALTRLGADYTEIMIPTDLVLQDVMIQNNYRFAGFLPSFWDEEDTMVFAFWKHRPLFLPKTKQIYRTIMDVDEYE